MKTITLVCLLLAACGACIDPEPTVTDDGSDGGTADDDPALDPDTAPDSVDFDAGVTVEPDPDAAPDRDPPLPSCADVGAACTSASWFCEPGCGGVCWCADQPTLRCVVTCEAN